MKEVVKVAVPEVYVWEDVEKLGEAARTAIDLFRDGCDAYNQLEPETHAVWVERTTRFLNRLEEFYRQIPEIPELSSELVDMFVPLPYDLLGDLALAKEELRTGQDCSRTLYDIKDQHAVLALILAPHTLRGLKLLNSASSGGKMAWTKQRELWPEYQAAVDALHRKRPNLSYNSILKIVAEQYQVSAVTVKRRTKNPKRLPKH